MMMKRPLLNPYTVISFSLLSIILLLPDASLAEPRARTVSFTCGTHPLANAAVYVPNFVTTMEDVSTQVRTSGFGTSANGVEPNRVYGLAQCYGDLSPVDCVLCYAAARPIVPQCYPNNGAVLFLDGCFVRATNYSFFQEYTGPDDRAICGNVTRQDPGFQAATRQALSQAVSTAPNNNGYARTQVAVSGARNLSVYVLAECWRTISTANCRACLENASASLSSCSPASEGRALNTGCFMRYSDTNFLNPIPRSGNISKGRIAVIVVSAVSAAAVLVIAGVIGFYMWRNRMIEKKRRGEAEKMAKTLSASSLNFRYSTIEKATGSFDEANKLGQGGFGTVYKGVLPDGREIAIKRLFANNRQTASDFYNEVNIISSINHKNLVRLLGCSCFGPESLLVYEYLPNKSLDLFIFDSSKGKELNWEKRFEIIVGTAEGLVHLHENTKTKIIHRDVKASNILLDSKLRAKIADFGLARSFQEQKTHVSTAIAGTLGYMAPEYLTQGRLTEKADVYGFGVLLLEIVTGRQNTRAITTENSDSLLTFAWKHFQQRAVEELFDTNLMLHNYHNVNIKNEILRVVHVAFLCTQEIAALRPSMSQALQMLIRNVPLPEPTNPPFLDDDTMEFNPVDYKKADSVANISQSIFYPR